MVGFRIGLDFVRIFAFVGISFNIVADITVRVRRSTVKQNHVVVHGGKLGRPVSGSRRVDQISQILFLHIIGCHSRITVGAEPVFVNRDDLVACNGTDQRIVCRTVRGWIAEIRGDVAGRFRPDCRVAL